MLMQQSHLIGKFFSLSTQQHRRATQSARFVCIVGITSVWILQLCLKISSIGHNNLALWPLTSRANRFILASKSIYAPTKPNTVGGEWKEVKGGGVADAMGTNKTEMEILRTVPDSLAFTCDRDFSLFAPPFRENLCICLSFPPSVKVSTPCITVFHCFWKHGWTHPSGNLYLEEWRGCKTGIMAIVEWEGRILNIYRRWQPLPHRSSLSLPSPSSNQTPTLSHHPHFLLRLSGFNRLFRGWHSRTCHRSVPIRQGSGWPSQISMMLIPMLCWRKQRASYDKHLSSITIAFFVLSLLPGRQSV